MNLSRQQVEELARTVGLHIPENELDQVSRQLASLLTDYGLRTLSDRHPGFDPQSYHRGSVWPFDSWLGYGGLRAAVGARTVDEEVGEVILRRRRVRGRRAGGARPPGARRRP